MPTLSVPNGIDSSATTSDCRRQPPGLRVCKRAHQGQWWSNPSTQLSQILQCVVRGVRKILHVPAEYTRAGQVIGLVGAEKTNERDPHARQNFRSCSFPSIDPCVNLQPVDTSRRSASSSIAIQSGRAAMQRPVRGGEGGGRSASARRSTWLAHLDPWSAGARRDHSSPSRTATTGQSRR